MKNKKWRKWRIRLISLAVILVIGVAYYFIFINYETYDFTHLMSGTQATPEEGVPYEPGTKSLSTVSSMKLALENDKLEFYLDENTVQFAVLDKSNGEIYYSNPQDITNDPKANVYEKEFGQSQFEVGYFNSQRIQNAMLSYTECTSRGQFTIERLPDGIRVIYNIGNMDMGIHAMPKFLTAERFDEIFLGNVDDAWYKKIKSKYYMTRSTKEGFMSISPSISTNAIQLNDLKKAFEQVGYTEEDLKSDNEAADYVDDFVLEYFKIPLEYRLVDDRLQVQIIASQIEETSTTSISYISLLKHFGAASSEQDGFIMVPSGTGGIINFNNGKTYEDDFIQSVYNVDYIIDWSSPRASPQVIQPTRLPVFGMNYGDHGYLAHIKSGESVARVTAGISGKNSSYNTSFVKFLLRFESSQTISHGWIGNSMTIIEKQIFDEDLVIEYCFLSEDASYSAMAERYRDILVEDGTLTKKERTGKMPLQLNTVGLFKRDAVFAGVPYDEKVTMTTYKQTENFVKDLNATGISNISVRYLGWFNKGLNQTSMKKINLESGVGSKKDMTSLKDSLEANGGNLFLNVKTQLAPYDDDSFNYSQESARTIFGMVVIYSDMLNRATMVRPSWAISMDYFQYVVSPQMLPQLIDKFASSYKKLNNNALSLHDLGDLLSSDMNTQKPVSRASAQKINEDQMRKLSEQFQNLLISGGNKYAFKYADMICDIPDNGNYFFLLDETIPFYQMVIHGFIEYTATPLNQLDVYDQEMCILKLLETGEYPSFTVSYLSSEYYERTDFLNYYSTEYNTWRGDIIDVYTAIEPFYTKTRNAVISSHVIHASGVRQTIYDNGASVYVNYTDNALEADGLTIPARGYVFAGI